MSDEHYENDDQKPLGEESASCKPDLATARRRMLRRSIAVSPVVLTLVSRPALAWHCKSPSAWGSEVINPNTSLVNNAGHQSYIDETWTITNWKTNTPRTGRNLGSNIVTGKPWEELLSVCPGLSNDETKTKDSNGEYVFDYSKVKIKHLVTYVPVINPGFNNTGQYVKDLLTTNKLYALIAQLNYVILKQVRANNGIDDCLRPGQLEDMARGTYMENGASWTLQKVKEYLYNNYIVRP